MPENTVKPGFEIEPIKVPEPEPRDPMDAHWQALIAERDKLKEKVERLTEQLKLAVWSDSEECKIVNAENAKLRAALEKIKFRNHPGTTNHELAKEALSRTSKESDA